MRRSLLVMAEYNEARDENRLEIDLGSRYWLDRVRWLSPAQPPPAYQIRVADGSLNPNGQRVWKIFPERQNEEAYQQVEESFALREVRYIDLRRLPWPAGRRESGFLSELLAFGEGFVSEVLLTSPIIKLVCPRLFTTVTWEGETQIHYRLEFRGFSRGEQPLREEAVDFIAHRFEDRVPRKSRDPDLSSQGSEHVVEGRGLLVPVPGSFASHSGDIVFAVAVLKVPEHHEGVGGEDENQGVVDGGLAFLAARVGPRAFLGTGTAGLAAPPAVLGILEPHGLLGISEGDLDLPSARVLNQDVAFRALVLGAEEGAVTEPSGGISGDDDGQSLGSGYGVPQRVQLLDQEGDFAAIDRERQCSPGRGGPRGELFRGDKSLALESSASSASIGPGLVIERRVHGHGSGERDLVGKAADQGLAGVFGVGDDVE